MMSALPQAASPSSLTNFLAAIGQAPTAGGEEGGFDQLLAAAPQPGAIAAAATPEMPLNIEGAPQPAADAEAPVPPVTAKVTATPVDTSASAAAAASLLIAVAGAGASATETKAAPALPTSDGDGPDVDTNGDPVAIIIALAEPAASVAAPVAGWTPVVAATPAAAKPAKPTEAAAVSIDDMATAAPAAKPTAAPPLPAITAPPAEPQAAKAVPADGSAAMTILFAQPAAQGSAPIIAVAAPAIIAERTLDLGSDDSWIEQLAHDIAATKSATGDVSFRLMPRHLGRLDVAMRQSDEGVSLRFDTRHEATATIVTAAQGRLVEDLRQQGVRVAGAEVTCTPNETGRQSQQQGRGAAQDPAHLIETATERAEPRPETDSEDRAADRRGRFA